MYSLKQLSCPKMNYLCAKIPYPIKGAYGKG